MISKEEIKKLKFEGNGALNALIRENKTNNKHLLYILEHLGHLPQNFDGSLFLELIESKNNQIRFWVVKNLGKLISEEFLNILTRVVLNDTDTSVRREAASSIGRMRNPRTKNILIEILKDNDPK